MPLWAPLVPQQRELAPLSATLWGDEVHPVLVCGECAGHEEMPFATLSALGTGGRRAGQAVQVPPCPSPACSLQSGETHCQRQECPPDACANPTRRDNPCCAKCRGERVLLDSGSHQHTVHSCTPSGTVTHLHTFHAFISPHFPPAAPDAPSEKMHEATAEAWSR